MTEMKFIQLSDIQKQVLQAASEAMKRAYCPYSHFAVGAALATPVGNIIAGANVENSAYGSTICAERSAICHANIKGFRQFEHLAIVVSHNGFATSDVAAPCGACRQMLWEFSSLYKQKLTLILATLNHSLIKVVTLDDLLPMAFGPGDMGFRGSP
ncbi:MAG: cytidine deaminase [Patescibacteria group bacterium]|nr:cytidine deaminase [Patescibacteria group bacterium]